MIDQARILLTVKSTPTKPCSIVAVEYGCMSMLDELGYMFAHFTPGTRLRMSLISAGGDQRYDNDVPRWDYVVTGESFGGAA